MHISAKADYALRSLLEIAAHDDYVSVENIVVAQQLPKSYVSAILLDLRRHDLVRARRGNGGYILSRSPEQITIASVIRAIDGPLMLVRGLPLEEIRYDGNADNLGSLWSELGTMVSDLLGGVSLADVLAGMALTDRANRADRAG